MPDQRTYKMRISRMWMMMSDKVVLKTLAGETPRHACRECKKVFYKSDLTTKSFSGFRYQCPICGEGESLSIYLPEKTIEEILEDGYSYWKF